MIAWLCASALAGPVLFPPPVPTDPPPPPPEDQFGVVDLGDLVVLRPVGDVLQNGFDLSAFDQAVAAALQSREETYDFVVIVNTDRVPSQFTGAGAFYLAYNNDDIEGTGSSVAIRPDRPIGGALWMNSVDIWDFTTEEFVDWVFGQELGHHWLAFTKIDRGEGPENLLLGRSQSHWSFFFDTGYSPVEGNRWIDNGDGTFSTDPAAGYGGFCDLDLYLMGLIEDSEVAPFFVIEPDESVDYSPSTTPDAEWATEPTTIAGTRVDLTVDHVIAAEGPVSPGPATSRKDHRILPILVVGPKELIDPALLDRVRTRLGRWSAAWEEQTRGLSTVDFSVADEGLAPPPIPATPTLVPRGAW